MLKKIGYGLIVWMVPYVSALPLLSLMQAEPFFFKTIMIIVGGLTGAVCAVLYFDKVEKDFLKEGIVLGVVWIVISWLLDFVGVIPFNKMTYTRYFMEIGLRYIGMLAPTVAVGYILSKKIKA
ncbi:hypothetical protein ACFL5U_03390 [Candidatus Margulisiibacteriota bacterium]